VKTTLKIAQLTPYYAPVIGGVEVVCQYISEELVSRGHEVHVLTANRFHKGSPSVTLPSYETIKGVHVHRFRSYLNIGHYGFFPGLTGPLTQEGFDIIHCHGYRQPQSEIASRFGARNKVPTVLHVHGGFYTRSRLKRLLYDTYDWSARRHLTNRFDHFIALSEPDLDRLVQLNVARDNISVVRNAAEPQAFQSANSAAFRKKYGLEGKKVVLYLSILHHFKRPDLLIQAFPRILAQAPDAFLVLAGPDAGELAKVQQLAKKLAVTDHYRWIGPLRGKEKHEAFECAEFIALPSDEDPYPLVLLEAMAHGKPLLTTSVVGQAPMIERNEAGIIIAPRDLSSLIDGAVRLLTDPPYRDSIGRNARRLAERTFSARAVVDEIETVYGHLTARSNA
jgi:glycosyltransferase involved in cell wall biosynthesis